LNGAPFLIVYQPQHLTEPRKTLDSWREYCEQNGIGRIHVCAALTNDNENYVKLGFDSGLQFPPHNRKCGSVNDRVDFYTPFHGCVVEYADLAQSYLDESYPHGNVFRTLCPSWDQTARVGSRAFIALNGTPANYEYWLKESIRRTAEDFPGQERFVFINAWNEWAEGCHLEPDRRFQRQFLEATLRVKTNQSKKQHFEDKGTPKAIDPPTSAAGKLSQVQLDLAIETRQRADAQHELAQERHRISEIYHDVEGKGRQILDLERDISAAREKLSAAKDDLSALQNDLSAERSSASSLRDQIAAQNQTISAMEQQLSKVKQELTVIQSSLLWRITRAFR
jgi:hypothetical protein